MAGVDLVVVYDLFPEMPDALRRAAGKAVARTADMIAGLASANAPELTGFMKSTIYTVTSTKSTYGQGVTQGAQGSYLLPEVEKPTNVLTAFVGVAANYSAYVNYGTIKAAAQPFFDQAVETARPLFQVQMESLEHLLRDEVKVP